MRALRLILADRSAGGAFALLLAWLLVLQGATVLSAQGAMAASGPGGPSTVICLGLGDLGSAAVPQQGDHPCCSGLCAMACGSGAALPPTDTAPAHARLSSPVEPSGPVASASLRSGAGLRPRSRAPPAAA